MTLNISTKCSDMFNSRLSDKDGRLVGEYNGYVPAWFPNPSVEHYGDYVELTIDLDTGKIVNWKKPTQKDLNSTFKNPVDKNG